MAKLSYQMDFDVDGDLSVASIGLEGRFLRQGFDFGKARATCAKMKRLSGPKKQSDDLGLKRLAGMIENGPPEPKGGWLVREEFTSLDIAIRGAVTKKLGKDYSVVDFSPSEVVLSLSGGMGDQYWKVAYKVVDGEVDFEGALISVRRIIDYI